MKTLHIAIVDKIATYQQRDGEIVCGNSDYVIEFAFDSEWDEHTDKVARFIIGNHYENVSFSGNTCPVPVITNTTSISVGVYAGNLCTTTPAMIGCKKSILCATAAEGKSPVLNGDSAYIRYSAYADGTDFTEEWHEDQNYIGFATGQTAPTTKEGYKWALFTQGTVDSELSETSENPIQNRAVAEALKNVSVDITVDSELSAESENPVQNKIVTQEFKAFNDEVGRMNSRLTSLEQSGGGGSGGVSSWNDLTDKPFGEEADGTVKQLDNKYLEPFESKDAEDLLPSGRGETFLSNLGVYTVSSQTTEKMFDRWQGNGDNPITGNVFVEFDGVTYECTPQVLAVMDNAVAVGNCTNFGGTGNGEPFIVTIMPDTDVNGVATGAYYWAIAVLTDTAPTEHQYRVYQPYDEPKYMLKESHLPFDAIAAYIDNYIDEALGGDY